MFFYYERKKNQSKKPLLLIIMILSNMELKAKMSIRPPSLSHLAVAYSLEADTDHRKKGRISRATFMEGTENGYDSKGTITMSGKGKKQCIIRQLAIQVATLRKFFSLDQSALWVVHNVV